MQATTVTIVVIGRWNRAILTPLWLQQIAFRTDQPIQIEVPVDLLLPPKVRFGEITIQANWDRLIFEGSPSNLVAHREMAEMVGRVFAELQKTPVAAAGVNFGFTLDAAETEVEDLLDGGLYDNLVESHSIQSRFARHAVEWKDGVVNIGLTSKQDEISLQFNFEKTSDDQRILRNWLVDDCQDSLTAVKEFVEGFGLSTEGIPE